MAVNYHEYIKTEAWRERAEAAKQRVGHRCQICNRPSARVTLDVHHRTYERLGNEHPEDLTVLCRGCHELYEKNRRIPLPPPTPALAVQPAAPTPTEAVSAPPSQQPAVLNGRVARRPFAPARLSPQRAALVSEEATADWLLLPEADHRYTLATEAVSPAASHYALMPASADQATSPTGPKAYHPHRRQQVGIALLVAVTLLLVAGLYEMVTLTPSARLGPLATATLRPVAPTTSAPTPAAQPTAAAVVDSSPTMTITQTAAVGRPTLTPTLRPTLPPTLLPSATPLPPIPTAVAPTVAPAPQNSVLRTGLVCAKPCSCAPIVRTITQGTPVTVLQTQLCGSDTWYQIGEAEWLGPGLVDPQ